MNNGFLTEYYILAADGTQLSEQESSATATESSVDVTPVETTILGVGTVFVGLVAIIIICAIMGFFCNLGKKDVSDETPAAAPANANAAPAAVSNEIAVDRGELAAAIAAAIAEETNTDIAGIKILSIKRV